MNDHTVVILERVATLTLRIQKMLEASNICVVNSSSEHRFYTSLASGRHDNVSLVILDLDMDHKCAIDVLIKTRQWVKNTPILVLTSGRSRNFFVEATLQGASDFVIKPFLDQTLISKVYKYLIPSTENHIELVALDLNRYIKGELRKAEKGSFPISLMFLHFENSQSEAINDAHMNVVVFENIRDLFWDTDIFIRFASKYYLGIFPFCDENNTSVIEAKMNARFEELKQKNQPLRDYNMISVFASYPFDTDDTTKVYDMLIHRINERFENIRISTDNETPESKAAAQ